MPQYDYRCKDCEALFEISHAMNFVGEVCCTRCDSSSVVKILNRLNFNLGGSGSGELNEIQRDHDRKFMPQKKRVQTLLNEMSSDKNPTVVGAGGCVQHTRMDLEDRYGSIF